jgi:hypothetical protein
VRGIGIVATVLMWLAMLGLVGFAITAGHFAGVVNQTVNLNVAADDARVADAGLTFGLTFLVVWLLGLAAGIAYWMWSWRARVNAEVLAGPVSQELSRGWTFWGWICPLVNFWFPCQILIDVYRASATRQTRGAGIVIAWWVLSVCCLIVPEIVFVFVGKASTPDQLYRPLVVSLVVILVLLAGSAVLMSVIVNRVSEWQQRAMTGPDRVVPETLSW